MSVVIKAYDSSNTFYLSITIDGTNQGRMRLFFFLFFYIGEGE